REFLRKRHLELHKSILTLVAVSLLATVYWLPIALIGRNLYDEKLRLSAADHERASVSSLLRLLLTQRASSSLLAVRYARLGLQGWVIVGASAAVALCALARNTGISSSWAFLRSGSPAHNYGWRRVVRVWPGPCARSRRGAIVTSCLAGR